MKGLKCAITVLRFHGSQLEVHSEETTDQISRETSKLVLAILEKGVAESAADIYDDDEIEPATENEIKKYTVNGTKERRRNLTGDEDSYNKLPYELSTKNVLSEIPVPLRHLVPGANSELVEKARSIVEKPVKQHKIFVVFGQYNSVKRALKRRGWLEKPCDCCRVPRTAANAKKICDSDVSNHVKVGSVADNAKLDLDSIISKLLIGVSPNLLWCTQRNKIEWKRLKREQAVNKFPHAHFTTKIGIHSCLQNCHWFTNFSMNSFFPRCYQVRICQTNIQSKRKYFKQNLD